MRREEREITDLEEIIGIIQKGEICRLGISSDNLPYIVPMNYGYADGHLYFHSAMSGRKTELMRENNLVCFEIETDTQIIKGQRACDWGMKYRSVIGYGRISEVHDAAEKQRGLSIIMNHYHKRDAWSFPDDSLDKVMILKLKIGEMTGKQAV